MLNILLKPVKELLSLFKKQNNIIKILVVLGVVLISQYVVSQLRWGLFSQTYTEEFGGKGGKEIVYCHMTTCGYCKKFNPEWDKFVQGNHIKTRKIEVNEDQDFMNKHGVTSFPTILLLDESGKKIDEYQGARDASGLAEYAAKVQK